MAVVSIIATHHHSTITSTADTYVMMMIKTTKNSMELLFARSAISPQLSKVADWKSVSMPLRKVSNALAFSSSSSSSDVSSTTPPVPKSLTPRTAKMQWKRSTMSIALSTGRIEAVRALIIWRIPLTLPADGDEGKRMCVLAA